MRAFGVAIFIPGGEQALLMELFRENPTLVSGDFHPWVEGKPLPMDLFRENARVLMGHFHAQVKGKGCSWIFSVSNGIGATFIARVMSLYGCFCRFSRSFNFSSIRFSSFSHGFSAVFFLRFGFSPAMLKRLLSPRLIRRASLAVRHRTVR